MNWRFVCRGLAVSLAGLVVLVSLVFMIGFLLGVHLNDLGKFWYGARDVFLDGASPYGPNPATQIPTPGDTYGEFYNLNPPHFYMLFAPLVHLRELGVFLVWSGASLAGLLLCLGMLQRETRLLEWLRQRWFPVLFLLACSGSLHSVLISGQITFILLPLFIWSWLLARRSQWSQAAFVLGILASIKPFFLLFAPLLIFRGRARSAVTLLSGVTLPYLFSLFVLGPQVHIEWLEVLRDVHWPWVNMNGSVLAVFSRALEPTSGFTPILNHPEWIAPLGLSIGGLVALVSIIVSLRGSTDRAYALLMLGAILASPLGWAYYALWALLPLMSWATSETQLRIGRVRPFTRCYILLIGALVLQLLYLPSEIVDELLANSVLSLLTGSTVSLSHFLSWAALVLYPQRPYHSPDQAPPLRIPLRWTLAALGVMAAAVLAGVSVGLRNSYIPQPRDETVVLVVLDNVRAQNTSLCGYRRPTTPYLDRLVAAGAAFSCEGVSGGSWTIPSHASLFTGLDVASHRTHYARNGGEEIPLGLTVRPLSDDYQTLSETLSAKGYQALGVSANPVLVPESGLTQGFDHFMAASDFGVLYQRNLLSAVRRTLRHRVLRDGTPLFLFVNISDAHAPWLAVPPGQGFVPQREPIPGWAHPGWRELYLSYTGEDLSEERSRALVDHAVDAYDFAVYRADAVLGWVLGELKAEGWLDGAFRVIVTSDHGELLGEHGEFEHGRYVWEELVRVPVVAWTSDDRWVIPEGPLSYQSVHRMVLGMDPNVCDLPRTAAFPYDILHRPVPGFSEAGQAAVYRGDQKHLWSGGSTLQVDLDRDPGEQRPTVLATSDPDLDRFTDGLKASEVRQGISEDGTLDALLKGIGYLDDP